MSSPTNSAASSGSPGGDWRSSVQQAHRNNEVREISRVLAALEPGASTSSKLRLAMQFEDSVFKAATSLADYQKTLTKKVKKLQKKYIPPAQQAPAGGNAVAADALRELRQSYGEPLLYIVKHAKKAVDEMKNKHGAEKANQLADSLSRARDACVQPDRRRLPRDRAKCCLSLRRPTKNLDQLFAESN